MRDAIKDERLFSAVLLVDIEGLALEAGLVVVVLTVHYK